MPRHKTKIFNNTPILVQDKNYLLQIQDTLRNNQCIQFQCEVCKKLTEKRLSYLKKTGYVFQCHSCTYAQKRNSKEFQEKMKQTCLERYGVEHPVRSAEYKIRLKQFNNNKTPEEKRKIVEKYKQTCLERYGVENVSQLQKCKDKKKTTYNSKSVEEKKRIVEKYKQTCLKKYGVENAAQSNTIKEKIKQICMEKYGVANVTYLPDHEEKRRQTNMKRYNCFIPAQSEEIKAKIKQTCLSRYGVENIAQFEVVKSVLKQKANSVETLKKRKQTMLQKYGSLHAPSNCYVWDNQSFDSSWELAVWIWSNETGKQIKREPIGLEYVFKDKIHYYYPDFEIDDQLVEIKGPHFFNKEGEMQNPYDHSLDGIMEAKHQCGISHGVQFWGEKEVQLAINHMKLKYGKDWQNQFKKK